MAAKSKHLPWGRLWAQCLPRSGPPRDAPFPARQGLWRPPNYPAHIWSSCAQPGLGHIILLQTLFSSPGLSHKILRRQDKVGAVCVSIPVHVRVCACEPVRGRGDVCAAYCDCPIDSQKLGGRKWSNIRQIQLRTYCRPHYPPISRESIWSSELAS